MPAYSAFSTLKPNVLRRPSVFPHKGYRIGSMMIKNNQRIPVPCRLRLWLADAIKYLRDPKLRRPGPHIPTGLTLIISFVSIGLKFFKNLSKFSSVQHRMAVSHNYIGPIKMGNPLLKAQRKDYGPFPDYRVWHQNYAKAPKEIKAKGLSAFSHKTYWHGSYLLVHWPR